jgi:hypothetical protein
MSLKHKQLTASAAMELTPKKGGPKIKVSLTMLLKTNVEKMSLCGLAMMSLKKSQLGPSCHDVDEKVEVSCQRSALSSQLSAFSYQ